MIKFLSLSLVVLSGCSGAAPTSSSVVPTTPIALATAAIVTPVAVVTTVADPFLLSTYSWHPSQYRATVTITNGADVPLPYLLAVFKTPYANGHPRFLESQELFSRFYLVLGPNESRTISGKIPEGCDVSHQADVFEGDLVGVNVHPTAVPKVHEATFKFGKSRVRCVKPPPPPPQPPLPCDAVTRDCGFPPPPQCDDPTTGCHRPQEGWL